MIYLVCLCEDVMLSEPYWTGMRYPAKSTIFPPFFTWKSYKQVFSGAGLELSARIRSTEVLFLETAENIFNNEKYTDQNTSTPDQDTGLTADWSENLITKPV